MTQNTVHLLYLFFFNDTATTEIYTLSLHDALPILIIRGYTMKRLDILIPHERLDDVNELLHKHKVGGMSFYEIKGRDRKSTRLNSSHANISYAVFCLKKKTTPQSAVILPVSHDAIV